MTTQPNPEHSECYRWFVAARVVETMDSIPAISSYRAAVKSEKFRPPKVSSFFSAP